MLSPPKNKQNALTYKGQFTEENFTALTASPKSFMNRSFSFVTALKQAITILKTIIQLTMESIASEAPETERIRISITESRCFMFLNEDLFVLNKLYVIADIKQVRELDIKNSRPRYLLLKNESPAMFMQKDIPGDEKKSESLLASSFVIISCL